MGGLELVVIIWRAMLHAQVTEMYTPQKRIHVVIGLPYTVLLCMHVRRATKHVLYTLVHNHTYMYSETSLYGHLVKRSPSYDIAVSRDGPKIFANTLHSY